MKSLFIIILMLLGCFNAGMAYEISGRVISIIDGATLTVSASDGQIYNVRLAGVDSPELNQEFGVEAKDFLQKISLEKNVTINITGKDRLGRYLGEILIEGKVDPCIERLKRGLTWTSEKKSIAGFGGV